MKRVKGIIEGLALWLVFIGIIAIVGCHDDKPIERAPIEVKAEQVEAEPTIVIQEYPRITSADIKQLEEEEAPDEEILEEQAEEAVEEPAEEVIEEVVEEPVEEVVEEYVEEVVEEAETAEEWVYLGAYDITAYEWTGYPCANGNYPTEGYTVACNSLPLGTVVYIDGIGYRTVEDRGATWHSDYWIDLYLGDVSACYEWGIRTRDVWIVY